MSNALPRTRFTVFEQVARTAHTNSPTYWNGNATGLVLDIALEAITGTSITFTVEAIDPITGRAVTILASAAKTGPGAFRLVVAPGATAVETGSATLATVAPLRWRLVPSGTITSVTYAVTAEYVNA
jgi:hypothetical protein